MSRQMSKTYGRTSDSSGTNAFDNAIRRASGQDKIFNEPPKNNKMSTAMASSNIRRFGNMSFTSTRSNPQPEAESSRKRPMDDDNDDHSLFDDPFSFDDEGPSRPKKGMGFKKGKTSQNTSVAPRTMSTTPKTLESYAPKTLASYAPKTLASYAPKTLSSAPKTLDSYASKTPSSYSTISDSIKTITKVTEINTKQESNGRLAETKPVMKGYSRAAKSIKLSGVSSTRTDSKKQTSMDSFTTKLSVPAEPSPRSDQEDTFSFLPSSSSATTDTKPKKRSTKSSKMKNKIFKSKNSVQVSPDHNYSANLHVSQSQTRDDHNYSQSDNGERMSPTSKDIWASDYDSDWDIDTGDPEITINSPHKRAMAAARESAVTSGTARNLRHQLESPITVSSGTEEADVASVCSDTSVKSNRTDPVQDSDDGLEFNSFKNNVVRTYGSKASSIDSNSTGSETFNAYIKSRNKKADSSKPGQTYGRSTKSNSVNNSSTYGTNIETNSNTVQSGNGLSSSQDTGADMYSGLTSSKPILSKLSSLQDRKPDKLNKPLVRRLLTSPQKGATKLKAVYNPRASWQSSTQESGGAASQKSSGGGSSLFDDFDEEHPRPLKEPTVMKRSLTDPARPWDDAVSTLKVTRQHKPLFTVVRNVKQAHECQEHGEAQEFEDEILYILDGVKDTENTATRCLSTVSLATKCTMPSFRMHLRAHNTLLKVFSELQDAPKYPTLALCTSAVMYMVSRDRMNMDIEKSTLQLMLALLSIDSQQMAHCGEKILQKEYDRLCEKVAELTKTMQKHGGVKNNKKLELQLEDVSIGNLAMETLLSLTAKSAGDWFKEELRTLGGLDHIINTVTSCSGDLDDIIIEPTESTLESCSKIDRCLRVLENITYLNSDNQTYLLSYNSSQLLTSLYRTLKVCENCMPFNEVEVNRDRKVNKECAGYIIYSCMLSVLRVMLNLTHDNVSGSTRVGQTEGVITTVLACILRVPQYVPVSERFDILVLGLGLVVNMVEHCEANRRLLVATKTMKPYGTLTVVNNQIQALEALSLLFNQCHDAARLMEEEHDAEMEEREQMRDGRTTSGSQASQASENSHDKSGEWKESESGLEWVVIPMEEEDPKDVLEKGGTLREALQNHYNQDNFDESQSDQDSDDLEVLPTSQEDDENFTKELHKYGRHMEDSIVAAYVALLLGCVVQGNSLLADSVRDYLPGCTFDGMIRMLKKFLGFMNFTSSSSNTGSKSITRVIEMLDCMNDS